MLTIIIFTNSNYDYLFRLLKDIWNEEINIWIVDYGKNPNKIKINFLKKKNVKLIFDNKELSFENRYYKYIKLAKTKYVWFVGDDDRLKKKHLSNLIKFINKKKNSGYTLSYEVFENDNQINNNLKIKKSTKEIESRNLKVLDDIHNLGMLSAQIINVNCFKKIEKTLNKKILLRYGYPHVYIILKIIKKFDDWQKIMNTIVYYRLSKKKILSKNILKRLDIEFKGYLLPIKEIYNNRLYKKLFKKIFIKNIISWIFFSIQNAGKKRTFEIINNNNKISPNSITIFFIKVTIFLLPTKLIKPFKKIKNFIF
jgi:IS1 family transposase